MSVRVSCRLTVVAGAPSRAKALAFMDGNSALRKPTVPPETIAIDAAATNVCMTVRPLCAVRSCFRRLLHIVTGIGLRDEACGRARSCHQRDRDRPASLPHGALPGCGSVGQISGLAVARQEFLAGLLVGGIEKPAWFIAPGHVRRQCLLRCLGDDLRHGDSVVSCPSSWIDEESGQPHPPATNRAGVGPAARHFKTAGYTRHCPPSRQGTKQWHESSPAISSCQRPSRFQRRVLDHAITWLTVCNVP